jgi:polyisoprenoid-binding protein YceI
MRALLLSIICLVSGWAQAAAPVWQVEPKDSSLTFTATQNDAPVKGEFKIFTSEINFDPAELSTSKVHIVVAVDSVTTSYGDVATTLKTGDWLAAKLFPKATFEATKFTKIGDKTYQAEGMLTLRDKTVPTSISFELEEYTKTLARVKGSTMLKRTAFGVGQGDWAKTDEIKDNVLVNFVLVAKK